jgi:hypothetical protein
LSWAVIGHLSAALDPEDLDPPAFQLRGRGEDVGLVGVPAEGEDGRVLEQEELVGDSVVSPFRDEPTLEIPRGLVVDPSEPARLERACVGAGLVGVLPTIEDAGGWLHSGTIAGRPVRAFRGALR